MQFRHLAAFTTLIALIVGCGGASTTQAPVSVMNSSPALGQAMLVINVPKATSGLARRGPMYVSPGTSGLIVTPSNYTTQTFTISPTLSSGCTNSGSPPQQYACKVIAVQGSGVTFTVTATAGANGSGAQLSTAVSAPMTIASTNSVINLILKAIPAHVTASNVSACSNIPNSSFNPIAFDAAPSPAPINSGNGGDLTPTFAAPMTVAVSGNPGVTMSFPSPSPSPTSSLTLNGVADLTSFTLNMSGGTIGVPATVTFTYNSSTVGSFTATPTGC